MKNIFRIACYTVLLTFSINTLGEDAARAWSIAEPKNIMMSPPGMLIPSSPEFSLPTLKGISIDPNDPFKVNFVVDSADQSLTKEAGQEQVNLLVRYFLSFLTLPEEELWVNLSPYEKNRIITPEFETTNAGRDMLVEDYTLKQLAASLTYPDHQLGKEFWKRVFKRVQAEYGTNDIPVTSFSKVWVVPDRAEVYEDRGSAFIGQSRLKVLTEEDYLSIARNSNRVGMSAVKEAKIDHISSEITREIIIPELEREVNEGKYFAPLRQMYNSLILAIWFKRRYKEDLIYQVYVNQKKTTGIALGETQIKEKIYARYLKALKKGVYNYIKEEADPLSNEIIPRKYFSGGFSFVDAAMSVSYLPASRLVADRAQFGKGMDRFTVILNPIGVTKRALMSLAAGALLMAGGMHAQASEVNDLTQINREITTLKADITNKENILHKEFMHREIKGGEYQMRWAGIGHEEGKLKKLQKQAQLIEVERHSGYLLPQMNKEIAILKADIAARKDTLHKEFMHGGVKGGEYLMRSSAIGYEEGKLIKLQKQAQLIEEQNQETPQATVGAVTPPVQTIVQAETPKNTTKPVAVPVAPKVPSEKVVAQPAPTPAAPQAVATTPQPSPAAPGSTITPPIASQVSIDQTNAQLEITVVPIAVEDNQVAENIGIVTGFDPDKKEYKAGERIFYLLDPELRSSIDQLGRELRIQNNYLSDLKKQGAPPQDTRIAQDKVDEITRELADANSEKESSVITAPHDLTIEEGTAVPNGTQVNKGEILLRYIDNQRVRVNFNVPTGLNYFNKIKDFTINGVSIKSIANLDWSFDPLQKNTQVSLVVITASPISAGKEAVLKAAILSPGKNDQKLDSVSGQAKTIASVRGVERYTVRSPVDGPVRFIVHEGQRVHKGQVLAYVYRLNGKLQEVRAPGSGVVISVSAYEQGAFQSQDELLRIGTGTALVGDINDIKNPVLFPRALTINNGDPVVVETPQGIYLPGRVTAVNKTPYSSTMDLSGFQVLEVTAFDQQNILQTNLPVQIILPKDDKEKKTILNALAQVEKKETNAVSAGAPPPDEATDLGTFISSSYEPFSQQANFFPPGPTNSPSSINLNTLAGLVDNNRLITGTQAIEVFEKKQEEGLPKAARFSINGGVYTKDGKVYFSGGLMGVLNNAIGGGIQSGNAYSAAVPLIYQLAGNIIDVVSGKMTKETNLARKMTEIAVHHMDTEVLHQVNKAQDLLINVGAADEKITQLKSLLDDLEKARSGIGALPGESTGADTVLEINHQLGQNIQDVQAQILTLEKDQENWTVALNIFTGQSNTNLHRSVAAYLPWGKQFGSIDEQTENQLREILIGTNSPNSRMKEAIVAGQAVDMTVKLQGLDKLPSLNMAGLFVSDGNISSSLIDASPNEGLFRTSEAVQGGNGGLQLNIPLFDSVVKTKAKVMALEKEKSELNLEKTKTELAQELEIAVGSIRNLSEQIKKAQNAYQQTTHDWELKAGSGLYLPYQLVDYRIEMNKRWQELVDLKAQYLKEEASLRSMGLLGAETSTQQDLGDIENNFQTVVSNSIAGNLTNDFYSFEEAASQGPADHILAPGIINYQAGTDVSSAWALMHNDTAGTHAGPLGIIKQILIEDPNIFVRNDALHHFLDEYQNDKEFLPALKDVVLHSPHADVVWGLLKFMGTQEDHGLHFFVETVNEAAVSHNQIVVDLGFQSLEDTFTMYPETLQGLVSSDFADPETADKVFLTLIARQPDSVASQRLLQSDYWDTDDLAKIYNSLTTYRIEGLSQLIYDSILRKEALNNIEETFRSGYFGNAGVIVLDGDILTHGRIEEIAQQNRVFLNLSPQWRRMQEYIHPKLYASAQEITQNLLSINQPGSLIPLFDDFLGVPAQDNELAYFSSIGLDAQRAYINESQKSHNISELARILNLQSLQTPLRAVVLDDLMADRQGRLLVLKTYVDASDPELLQLIEGHSWTDTIREDIKAVKNSSDIQILREALEKMYGRTQKEWAWNIIDSWTYSDPELHSLHDPRGDAYRTAQINVAATKVAIRVIQEENSYKWVLWAGYRLQSPQEVDELEKLKQKIDQQTDPVKIMADLDHRANSITDSKTKKMFKNIISIRDQIAHKIANNDQAIPKFPFLWWSAGVMILLGSTVLFFKNLFKGIRRGIQNKDTVNNILHIADRVTSLEYVDRLNGAETSEPNRQMVETRADGLKIINMPQPRNVEQKAQRNLYLWWQQVIKWNKEEGGLSNDEILHDFHQMTTFALDALKTIPYDPKMMQSPSGQYQKTLFYFITMANYTLYLLTKQLENKDLNDIQKGQLKHDTNDLVRSIKYASDFSLFLHYRANIQRVLTRKLPDNHPSGLEKKRWWLLGYSPYGIARSYLLFEYLFSKSYKKGNRSIDDLLTEGNGLLGLYPDKETIKTESEDYLKDVVSRGGMDQVVRAHDAEITDKIGNFWREIKYPIQAGVILSSTIGSILVFPGFASFAAEISTFALVFHFWSVWFYAKPNLDFLDTTWSKEINDLAGKQQQALNKILDSAQLSSSEKSDAAMTVPDEIDQRIISQLMTGYSADGAAPELLIPIIEKNLSGDGENIKVENADLKRVFYLMRLFKNDSLLNRLKKTNSKEILFMSSLRGQKEFTPTTIEDLNRDLQVIHINVNAREYYFIVGATYPTLVRMKDVAMQTVVVNPKQPQIQVSQRGGVDFSKTKDSIVFKQNENDSSAMSNPSSLTTLKLFKGFDFQVIQYQPISNPVDFLLGSSMENTGFLKPNLSTKSIG